MTIAASVGASVLVFGTAMSAGAQVSLPTSPVTAPVEEVPPPATPGATSTSPKPTTTAPAKPTKAAKPRFRILKRGHRGVDVRALQRALRKRKHRIAMDGVFGRRTKVAVRRQQRRFKMRRSGVATVALQRRLRLKPRWRSRALNSRGARHLQAFPVVSDYTYSRNFGDARHQGAHEGIDILAPQGTTIVAAVSGVIDRVSRVETGLGGKWIWQRDSRGNEYYYAHLHTLSRGLRAGSKVTAGQPIGTVGETGDARGTTPHLHMEVHPKGGAAIDFYSDLIALDPAQKTVSKRK